MLKEGIHKIENIKGSTDGQTWRRMKRIQLWCMNKVEPGYYGHQGDMP